MTDGVDQIFLTWSKPTSTGVSRPKIETSTLSLAASWLISAISPEKSDSGPETTLTDSPIENWALRGDLLRDLAVQQAVDLGLGERDRLVRRADEAGDAGRALDERSTSRR